MRKISLHGSVVLAAVLCLLLHRERDESRPTGTKLIGRGAGNDAGSARCSSPILGRIPEEWVRALPTEGAPSEGENGRRRSITSSSFPGILLRNEKEYSEEVRFYLRDRNASVYFTRKGFTLAAVQGDDGLALQLEFAGGRESDPRSIGETGTAVNHFVGNQSEWKTNRTSHKGILYSEVWPSIDVVLEPRPSGIEYSMIVRPGGSVESIRLVHQGHQKMELSPLGALVLETEGGSLLESAPFSYQGEGPTREEVPSSFRLNSDGTVSFDVSAYDPSRTLVIDPTLTYGTFLGSGNGSSATGETSSANTVAVDLAGSVYVAGKTNADFPTSPGAFSPQKGGNFDAFVAKIRADASALEWSTFLGGRADDTAYALAVNETGDVFVAGSTKSNDFPTTAGAYDRTYNRRTDGFVTKVNAGGGSLGWSTFVGGNSQDEVHAVALDGAANLYMAGMTRSATFPTTGGAFDRSHNGSSDVFVGRIRAGGAALDWSTFLGGAGFEAADGLAIDGDGNAYVTGSTRSATFPTVSGSFDVFFNGFADAFVTKINAGGSTLGWSTFLGGPGPDNGLSIAVDPTGNIYVTGRASSGFPTTPGAYDETFNGAEDVYVARIRAGGDSLDWSTFLGGEGYDLGYTLALDGAGAVYVAGLASGDYPTTPGSLGATATLAGLFITKVNPGGSTLAWSARIESSVAHALVVDGSGNVIVVGSTYSPEFPPSPDATDMTSGEAGFVMNLDADGTGMEWSTLLQGSGAETCAGMAIDSAGNVYVAGSALSIAFPTTAGAFDATDNGQADIVVTKLTTGGGSVAWSTFLGGESSDTCNAITVDSVGNVYVAGGTWSVEFPTTDGAYGRSKNLWSDAFVTQILSDGRALGWSTYLGGCGTEAISGMAVDGSGNVYVTGNTSSRDYPTTEGAYDRSNNGGSDVFITRIAARGRALEWSTLLGGERYEKANALTLDGEGNAYITGETYSPTFPTTVGAFDRTQDGGADVFVGRVSSTGSALDWCTLLGGTGNDRGFALAVDGAGNAYVTGSTSSRSFPITIGALDRSYNGGAGDVFVAKINSGGALLGWSTYLGGRSDETGYSIAVDGAGNVYVAGESKSATFPTTTDAYDRTYNGKFDAFVTKLTAGGGALNWSTFYGGAGDDSVRGLAVDAWGSVFVAGTTSSILLPTAGGAFDSTFNGGTDFFIARF